MSANSIEQQPAVVKTERVASNAAVVWSCVALIALAMVLGVMYVVRVAMPQMKSNEPGTISRLEVALEAVEKSGKPVSLGELHGKVFLIAYVYTSCPRGCAGVVSKLKELEAKFGSNPNFHIVSVSVYASNEKPELLKSYAEAHGVDKPNWWFLTGDEVKIRDFMTKQVKMLPVVSIPEEHRIGPGDLFEHDLRIALVDHNANVRGQYQVMNPDDGIQKMVMEQLEEHLDIVLKAAEKDKKAKK